MLSLSNQALIRNWSHERSFSGTLKNFHAILLTIWISLGFGYHRSIKLMPMEGVICNFWEICCCVLGSDLPAAYLWWGDWVCISWNETSTQQKGTLIFNLKHKNHGFKEANFQIGPSFNYFFKWMIQFAFN